MKKLKVAQLKAKCKELGLATTGKKSVLQTRFSSSFVKRLRLEEYINKQNEDAEEAEDDVVEVEEEVVEETEAKPVAKVRQLLSSPC